MKTEKKLKNIIFNHDLIKPKFSEKIYNIFGNETLKNNEKFIKKFKDNFTNNEIDEIYYSIFNNNLNEKENIIAYFSMEYGINDFLPNYSGGLGILAGDHLKQSSENKLNLYAVGLFYKYGYFHQNIFKNKQIDSYYNINIHQIPHQIVCKKNNEKLIIKVRTDKTTIYAQVWKIKIGKSILFLLDTDIEENKNIDIRNLTDKLYSGNREKRFLQEMLIGIGGMKLFFKLGLYPSTIHINEGHVAFALLERIRKFMKTGLDFKSAFKINYETSIFTTHTPIIHGNEEFEKSLVEKHLSKYLKHFDLTVNQFIEKVSINKSDKLMMTVLSLKFSKYSNAVSKLHSDTATKMWKGVLNENRMIPNITNGIHLNTWLNNLLKTKFFNVKGDTYREKISYLTEDDINNFRNDLKNQLINYVNKRFKKEISIDKSTIIIGFARRFAPYKRAFLLFNDMHRLKRILNHKNIIVFISGKAHPQDTDGKKILNEILEKIDYYQLQDRIIFLENYDIELAKRLTSGCDIWLNTPLKPMEASGTSGMKSALNGGINFSVLDGWWYEAYNEKNGFIIREFNAPDKIKNYIENSYLLDELEYKIIPIFRENINKKTILIKESMITAFNYFLSGRMLNEYGILYDKCFDNYNKNISKLKY